MCGIAGAVGARPIPPDRILRTLGLMRNRGPDQQDHKSATLGDGVVDMLFARLSIIDPGPQSDQPFERDGVVLTFNGEIYNYLELRRELEGLGHRFRTASDTEVLLVAWLQWGVDCLDRLEGMWAFALFDRKAERLVLSRDRFGEKPLHIWEKDGVFFYGSEVKLVASLASVAPKPDLEQLRRYLVLGYKSLYKAPNGWFKGVRELPAASYMIIDRKGRSEPVRYWSVSHAPVAMTEAQALEGATARLEEAVRLRIRADVPIAFCMSGGIDSTTIAGIAAKRFGQTIHTFSILDDDERYDEADNIKAQVEFLGCENISVRTSTEGFLDRLAVQVAYHDGPVATLTYYLHEFLSEQIHACGYRVAISGTAADEIFSGYYDHYAFWLAAMSGCRDFTRLLEDWRGSYGAFVQNPLLRDPLVFARRPEERGHIYLNQNVFNGFMTEPVTEPFEETAFTDDLLRNRMLNELLHEATPVILKEDDLNSMRWSLENRSPYLDRCLVEFMNTVPSRYLIKDGYAKWLLRAAGAGVVADQVRFEKRKRGFNAPIDSLLRRDDSRTRERLLEDSPIFDLVRRDAIEEFIGGSMADNSFSKFLFSFISAKTFLEHLAVWRP